MALEIPTTEPLKVYQGTDWRWKRPTPDHDPNAGYFGGYTFRNETHSFGVSLEIANNQFEVNELPAATADYPAGVFDWQLTLEKSFSTDKELIGVGQIEVIADLAAVADGYETRTFAKRMLDAIEARLEGTADRDDISYSTEGLSVARYTPEQLDERRSFYKRQVINEERARRARNGQFHSGRIFTRLP